jgi:AcrR family transcriptional regulator
MPTTPSSRRTRSPRALPRGRHGLPRSFVASNQRERILDGVATVCHRRGYAEMAVQDITVAAGVSRKTFYEHFRNKDDAFVAAYDEMSGRLLGHVREALRNSEGFEDGVIHCLRAFLEFIASEPSFAQLGIVEVLAAGPEAVERRNQTMRSFAELIERGAELGVPGRRPPELTAETLVGGIYEVVYSRVLEGKADELPQLLPDLAYTVTLPYAGRDAAARVAQQAQTLSVQ